jgi:hypothetical protein
VAPADGVRGDEEVAVFEAVEYVEEEDRGRPTGIPSERLLGLFPSEADAIVAARRAKRTHVGRNDYAWWVVRRQGERLATWIADSRSGREFVMDLTSERIVEFA